METLETVSWATHLNDGIDYLVERAWNRALRSLDDSVLYFYLCSTESGVDILKEVQLRPWNRHHYVPLIHLKLVYSHLYLGTKVLIRIY